MYKPGSYDASRFSSVFDLKPVSEEDAYSKGSSTGTKQVAGLGTYLTEDDYKRLRNSDKVKDAYAEVYGQSEADSKFEGNPDGLSINALDALFDKLAKVDQVTEQPKTSEPDPVREKAAESLLKAIDRTNEFKADMEGTGNNNLSDSLFVPRRDTPGMNTPVMNVDFNDSFENSFTSFRDGPSTDAAVDVIESSSMPSYMKERALGSVSPQGFLEDAKKQIMRTT